MLIEAARITLPQRSISCGRYRERNSGVRCSGGTIHVLLRVGPELSLSEVAHRGYHPSLLFGELEVHGMSSPTAGNHAPTAALGKR